MGHHSGQPLRTLAGLPREPPGGSLPRGRGDHLITQRTRIAMIEGNPGDESDDGLLIESIYDGSIQVGYRMDILFDP